MATLFDPRDDFVRMTLADADEFKSILEDATVDYANAGSDLTPLAVALAQELGEVIDTINDIDSYAGWTEEAATILDNAKVYADRARDEILRAVQATNTVQN